MDFSKEPHTPSKKRHFNWTDFKEWSIHMSIAIASAIAAALGLFLANIQGMELNSGGAMVVVYGIAYFFKRLATDYEARYSKNLEPKMNEPEVTNP